MLHSVWQPLTDLRELGLALVSMRCVAPQCSGHVGESAQPEEADREVSSPGTRHAASSFTQLCHCFYISLAHQDLSGVIVYEETGLVSVQSGEVVDRAEEAPFRGSDDLSTAKPPWSHGPCSGVHRRL